MTGIKINERISYLRREKNVTQQELAQALGVTNQSVSKWESGACCPDIALLPDIAAFFGVSVDELLGCKPALSDGDIVLTLKSLFENTPPDDALPLAAAFAGALHRMAVKRRCDVELREDEQSLYNGVSITSEPEGASVCTACEAYFFNARYYKAVKPTDLRAMKAFFELFASMENLKVLFAIYELTRTDFDGAYVTSEEIAKYARLPLSTVTDKCLPELPVEYADDAGTVRCRLEGSFMHIPPLLLLLCK